MAFTQLTKEQAKDDVKKLVDKYSRIVESGRLMSYNEERTKKEFIEPLFEALGWDIRNTITDDEVLVEEKISKGRVDYSFRLGGIPKFFLEAKSLKEDLDNPKFIQQAIDYSWHKSCTWAVLTDFEAVKIFNAEWKSLNPLQAQFLSLPCHLFLEKFDQLWLLSKESFEKKLLDSEAEKWGKKIKKIPVDKQLLTDLTIFRELLTKNILKANASKNLSADELDEAVQRIIDRFIFLRTLEDKELEPKILEPLIRESNSKKLYTKLKTEFRRIDEIYNSKLFAFHLIDQDLSVDDDVLEKVINGLFRTTDNTVHYDFSAIDADVLGNIYEQYLGHILKKTEKRAKLSEGKAHRKEQGIYYTPTYVVDYIVKNTISELAKYKNVDLKTIKVLDPACGSGSFLMKAFDYLVTLDKKRNGDVDQTKLDLTGASATYGRKVEILKKNIFGVDLDPKAVEIAQLNLLLKAAEKKHRLPMLQENIKVGNSLIDDPEIAGPRAFKWEEQFKDIIAGGGFDVVIGNPPYGIVFNDKEKEFIEATLPTFRRNNDLYVAFIEKSINLLKNGGFFSFIVPNTYLRGTYFDNLKKLIIDSTKIVKILDFGINQVFKDPNVFNSIIILQKEPDNRLNEKNKIEYYNIPLTENLNLIDLETVSVKSGIVQKQFQDLCWKPKNKIIEKINQNKLLIDAVCHIKDVGFNYWSIGRGKKRGGSIGSRVLYDGEPKNKLDTPFLKGRDISRWVYSFGNHWLKHDYEKYLDKKTDIFRFSSGFLEATPKIIYRQTADRIIATIDLNKYYSDKTVHLIVPKKESDIDLYFLLGILNSKLMLYYYKDLVHEEGRTFAQVKTIYIKKIPLVLNNKSIVQINQLVKKQLDLNKMYSPLKDKQTDEKIRLENEIQNLDAEIDQEVYKLYGLTKEEIQIIEESLK